MKTDPAPSPQTCRILVLMPNWLGDAVMATGLLTLLADRRRLPDGRNFHITLGVRGAWASLFQGDPRCDDLLIVERTGHHGGLAGTIRLARELARGRYQAVCLGPPSLRVALATALARIPIRVGYAADWRTPLLTQVLPTEARGTRHYFHEMLQLGEVLLQTLGVEGSSRSFPARTSLPACLSIPAAPASECPRWILAPGATYGLAKTWPLEQALEFCKLAVEQEGVELVLLGDKTAGSFARDLGTGLGMPLFDAPEGRPGLVDLTGRTSLTEVVALLKSALVFVGNDSGLMHLSAALGTPTVGIFGSSNPAWTAPVGTTVGVLAPEGFSCQPCYRRTCNQPRFCLETIAGRQVLTEAKKLITGGKGDAP